MFLTLCNHCINTDKLVRLEPGYAEYSSEQVEYSIDCYFDGSNETTEPVQILFLDENERDHALEKILELIDAQNVLAHMHLDTEST